MIAKGTTVTVNFYAITTDGLAATGQASNITATISINGNTATAISDTITEKGSGWYKFNHTFNTAGNAFIEFSASGCVIMPWEDNVVDLTAIDTALSGLLHWTVSSNTLTLYNPTNTAIGTYTLTRDSSGNITSVTPNA